MNVLECIVGLGIGMMVLAPMLKTTSAILTKQTQLERVTSDIAEQERIFTLIGRAIRMAAYRDPLAEPVKAPRGANAAPTAATSLTNSSAKTLAPLTIRKGSGLNASDELIIHHGLHRNASKKAGDEVDFDCVGNPITTERTQKGVARLGFSLDRHVGNHAYRPVGSSHLVGSLMCESFDRQGRSHKTTLMTGIEQIRFDEVAPHKIQVELTVNQRKLVRIYARRNTP